MNKHPSIVTHPVLINEWFQEMNRSITPDKFTLGSGKKVWWKCSKDESHIWKAVIASRTSGVGCPFCANKRISSTNSLDKQFPQLVAEWHQTKNGFLKPSDVVAGTHRKVWWKCDKGSDHEWEADINNRSKGVGCPVCRGLKVVKSNCLATMHPAIARQWHTTKNLPLTPFKVTRGSHKRAWWQCSIYPEHIWQTAVSHRVNGTGCPYCANQKVSITNSLATIRPDLIKEWHPSKNGNLKPSNITAGGNKKVWWKCSKAGHEWETKIRSRVSRNLNCPLCSNQRVSETNNVLVMRPDLAKQWRPTKNGKLLPKDVVYGSNWHIWWQCPKAGDHVWEASVAERKSGNNCPYCSNQKLSTSNSLLALYPNLAKEWHPGKNGNLKPEKIVAGGNKKHWWFCSKGTDHEWESSIYNRIIGKGCPVCQGLKVVLSNSLFTTHPEIANQWHPTKNETLSPKDVVAASMKKVWWQCPTVKEHNWKAIIDNRTRKGYGCPECGVKLDISQKKLFEIVKKIFIDIDKEILYRHRPTWLKRMELDIFVPTHNLAFEYQGRQHLEPTPFFGGEKAYVEQVARDKLKRELCRENDITLIYVDYTDKLDEASIRDKIIKTGLYSKF